MNKNIDLETFAHDDWLEKERIRESKVSAWDFDDARKLRQEHADDCDVKETAQLHHQRHLRSELRNDRALSQMDSSRLAQDIVWFVILIIAMVILIVINTTILRHAFMLPVVILFLGINPGIFIWLFLFKRFPSARYSRTLLVIAILLELAYYNLPYLRYLIFRYF